MTLILSTLVSLCMMSSMGSATAIGSTNSVDSNTGQKSFEHNVYFEKTDFELHIFKIHGRNPGPTLMIIGGIQGDEPGSYISADMYADVKLKKGNLIVVPRANFRSIMENKRQINQDMNVRFYNSKAQMYEDKVVAILRELIAESDFLLNLHEGSGFYNSSYIDDMNNPNRFGQCIIADTDVYLSPKYNKELRLEDMAQKVIDEVNDDIEDPQYKFKFSDHRTATDQTTHKTQRESATFYALYTVGIPAFGVEASKEIKDLNLKVKMISAVINAFMDNLGIKRDSYVDLMPPTLKYMLVKVNGENRIISRGDTLYVPRKASIEIDQLSTGHKCGRDRRWDDQRL
jgi:hypothetical protein